MTSTESRAYTLLREPWYFGAYLNLARLNVQSILNEINTQLHRAKPITDDAQMIGCAAITSLGSSDEEQSAKALHRINRQFPFLEKMIGDKMAHLSTVLDTVDRIDNKGRRKKSPISETPLPGQYKDILVKLLELLNHLRNEFSHSQESPKPLEVDKSIFHLLYSSYDAALKSIREKRELSETDIAHLVRYDNRGKLKTNFMYSFEQGQKTGILSEKGLAFFICLFLETGQTYKFLDKLQHFKSKSSASHRATLEVFAHYHARIPRPKLLSDNSANALLMDTVNELKKCPRTLFDTLSINDQEYFKVKNAEAEEAADLTEETPESLLVRKESRFWYLSLRFAETLRDMFRNINFQIDHGDYYWSVYEKQTLGTTVTRRLRQRLFSQGHLRNFSRADRPEHWIELLKPVEEDTNELMATNEPFITDTNPHYHFDNNRICISIGNSTGHPTLLQVSPDSKTKHLPTAPKSGPNMAWLSLYDLPAMAFWALLKKHGYSVGDEDIKNLLNRTIKSINAFLKATQQNQIPDTACVSADALEKYILDTYQLPADAIPERIKAALLSLPNIGQQSHVERLQLMLKETETKLQRLKTMTQEPPKLGKQGERVIKGGFLADFLVEDMMRFQPALPDGKGKANDSQYRILQYRLAYFSLYKEELPSTFQELRLIDSDNPHPFLHRVNIQKATGVLSFYKAYLETRRQYLLHCLDVKKFERYHFLRFKSPSPASEIAEALLQMPFNLPKGLFDAPIIRLLEQKEGPMSQWLAAQKAQGKPFNMSYLIKHYHKVALEDSLQHFYDFKRGYRFIDKVLDDRTQAFKPMEEHFLTPAEIKEQLPAFKKEMGRFRGEKQESIRNAYKALRKSQTEIRLFQTEDILLYMMGIQLLAEEQQGRVPELLHEFKLQSLRHDMEDDRSLLSQLLSYSQTVTFNIDNENIYRKQGLPTKAIQTGERVIKQADLKLKNFGDFKRLLHDRRLNALLPYFLEGTDIDKSRLDQELLEFERLRVKVFEYTYKFETALSTKLGASLPSKLAAQTTATSEHEKYLLTLQDLHPELFPNGHLAALTLRNGFSHNQYPSWFIFKDRIDPSQPIAPQFEQVLQETYIRYIEALQA